MTRSRSISKAIFEQLVVESVEPFAEGSAFQKSSTLGRFYRWQGDALWNLNCGFRMEKNRDEGWVSVSMGVGFRSLDQFLQNFPELGGVDPAWPCAMGTDTGHLRGGPPFHAVQWRVLPDSDAKVIGPAVVDEMRSYALPYFERFGTLEKALAAWESGIFHKTGFPHGDCYITSAYWLRGERPRALSFMKERLAFWQNLHQKEGSRSSLNMISRYEAFLDFLVKQL